MKKFYLFLFGLIYLHTKILAQSLDECSNSLSQFIYPEMLKLKKIPTFKDLAKGDTVYLIKEKINDNINIGFFYSLNYVRDVELQDIQNDQQMQNAEVYYKLAVPEKAKDFIYQDKYLCRDRKLYELVPQKTNFADWIVIKDNSIKMWKNEVHHMIGLYKAYNVSYINKLNKIHNKGTAEANLNDYADIPLIIENVQAGDNFKEVVLRVDENTRLGCFYIQKEPVIFANLKAEAIQNDIVANFSFQEKIVLDEETLFNFENEYFKVYKVNSISFEKDRIQLIADCYNGINNSIIEKNSKVHISKDNLKYYSPECFKKIWLSEKKEYDKLMQANKREIERNENVRLHLGPRGGCYYISASGLRVYVDRSLCR